MDTTKKLSLQQKRALFTREKNPINSVSHLDARVGGKLELNHLERTIGELIPVIGVGKINFIHQPINIGGCDPMETGNSHQPSVNRKHHIDDRRVSEYSELLRDTGLVVEVAELGEGESLLRFVLDSLVGDAYSLVDIYKVFVEIYSGEEIKLKKMEYEKYVDIQYSFIDDSIGNHYLTDVSEINSRNKRYISEAYGHYGSTTDVLSHRCEFIRNIKSNEIFSLFVSTISRITNKDTVYVNEIFDGRIHEEVKESVGLYSFDYPFVITVDDSSNISSIRQQIDKNRQEAIAHHMFVQDDISNVGEYGIEFIDIPETKNVSGCEFSVENVKSPHGIYGLKLNVVRGEDCNVLIFEYSTKLYSENLVNEFIRMFEHISRVGLSEDALRDISTMDVKNTYQTYAKVNCGDGISNSKLMLDRFTECVKNNYSKMAVIYNESRYSYGELDSDSNVLSKYINRTIKHTSGCVIGVILPRSYQMLVSLIGVMKSGAAYCVIDVNSGFEKVSFIMSQMDVVITDGDILDSLNLDHKNKILLSKVDFLDNQYELDCAGEKTYKSSSIESDPAYILYTSGTTGNPKGVIVSQRSFSSYLDWACDKYVEGGANSIVHTSVGFDLTVTSLYIPLLVGGFIDIVDEKAGIDGLKQALKRNKTVSLLKLTPSHLKIINTWIDSGELNQIQIKTIVVGGESLYCNDVAACFKKFEDVRIFNEYGPTEATVGCCIKEMKNNMEGKAMIGLPSKNSSMYILDKKKDLSTPWAEGEIYISGKCLSNGYYKNDEETRNAFLYSKAIGNGKERIYKTGDLGRLVLGENGWEFEYLGRQDRQLKINGYRVELDEIECGLRSVSGVKDACVIFEKIDGTPRRLIAFVVMADGVELEVINESDLGKMPDYMKPKVMVSVEKMILTKNGKIDADKLVKNYEMELANNSRYVAATTELERKMVMVWSNVLGKEKVSMEDDFFSLGGDSIKGVELVAKAKSLGMFFTMQDIFELKTAASLVKKIQTEKEGESLKDLGLLDEIENIDEEIVAGLLAETIDTE